MGEELHRTVSGRRFRLRILNPGTFRSLKRKALRKRKAFFVGFDALLATGHSLIVVEHNVQMMRAADWLIDLGPGAADDGGRIVAHGTREKITQTLQSATGKFLQTVGRRRR